MTENVIDFPSRRPLVEVQMEEQKTAEEIRDLDREAHLQAIDNLRRLVEQDKIRGLVLLGRHTELGLPYQDVIFPQAKIPDSASDVQSTAYCQPDQAYFYTGLLETLKLEFADMAQMAPCIMPDGNVMKPHYEELEFLDDGE